MFSHNSRKALATALAGAALASAVGASGAAADQYMDSPDAREAALAEQPNTDLRMPDTVDAAREASDPSSVAPPPSSIAQSAGDSYEDLRMPDSRERADGYSPTPDSLPVADEPSTPGAFDWLSAALGVAAAPIVLGLVLLARRLPPPARHPRGAPPAAGRGRLAALTPARHRRRQRPHSAASPPSRPSALNRRPRCVSWYSSARPGAAPPSLADGVLVARLVAKHVALVAALGLEGAHVADGHDLVHWRSDTRRRATVTTGRCDSHASP